jgi:hypothetical protein
VAADSTRATVAATPCPAFELAASSWPSSALCSLQQLDETTRRSIYPLAIFPLQFVERKFILYCVTLSRERVMNTCGLLSGEGIIVLLVNFRLLRLPSHSFGFPSSFGFWSADFFLTDSPILLYIYNTFYFS